MLIVGRLVNGIGISITSQVPVYLAEIAKESRGSMIVEFCRVFSLLLGKEHIFMINILEVPSR